MNMNGQAYQQTAKPKKQRAPRKPGAFGPFAAKTVAAALIFGLVGGGVFTGVSYIGRELFQILLLQVQSLPLQHPVGLSRHPQGMQRI